MLENKVKGQLLLCLLVALVLMIISFLFYKYSGYPLGQIEALYDLSNGSCKIKRIGRLYPWWDEYIRLLKERHLSIDTTVTSFPSMWEKSYRDGYNSISKPIIKNLVSDKVFRECYRQSIITYMSTHKLSKDQKAFCEHILSKNEVGVAAESGK